MGLTLQDDLPPFPQDVPTVPIARISHQKLLQRDEAECARALRACQTDGFFYLDLRTSAEGEALLDESDRLLALAKKAFDMPQDAKNTFTPERGVSIFGYRPPGRTKTTDKDQRQDTTEFFNIAKDHRHGFTESRTYPNILLDAKPLLKDFMKNAHACGQLALAALARQLGLAETEFTDKNTFNSPSGDHVRMTKKRPHTTADADGNAIGLASHTDFGSITILFNWLGGLQIQRQQPQAPQHNAAAANDEGPGEWAYVKPLPGHAIINLGDASVKFSNGALKSAKHRVVPAPGAQGGVDRYSVVYFVRPADETLMQPVEKFRTGGDVVKVGGKVGEEETRVYTAGEWNARRLKQMAGVHLGGN